MIVFVIPLKSQQVSKSWSSVCHFFERTVRSLCRQTDSNFQIIVVCHEKPDIQFSHPQIHYKQVNFPIPTDYHSKSIDRTRKNIAGLYYARQFSPDHVMVVDADDCLSCHLAEFTNQSPQSNGWFLDKGYVYQEGSYLIYRKSKFFYSWCGTCNILRFDLYPPPENYDDYSQEIADFYYDHNHVNIPKIMSEQGTPLEAVPFLSAVYSIGNGENIYQQGFSSIRKDDKKTAFFYMKESLKYRLLTQSIRKEFGLSKIIE